MSGAMPTNRRRNQTSLWNKWNIYWRRIMEILFEDNHIIVVSKPQGVASQPDETGDKDILTQVKEYIKGPIFNQFKKKVQTIIRRREKRFIKSIIT